MLFTLLKDLQKVGEIELPFPKAMLIITQKALFLDAHNGFIFYSCG